MFKRLAIIFGQLLLVGLLATSCFVMGYRMRSQPISIPVLTSQSVISIDKYRVFELVNEYRVEKGLKSLKYNPLMCEFTEERAKQIPSDWSHNGYLNVKYFYSYQYFGENLARGYTTPEEVLANWKASPTHNKNLIDPNYTDTCISSTVSVATDDGMKYNWIVEHLASF